MLHDDPKPPKKNSSPLEIYNNNLAVVRDQLASIVTFNLAEHIDGHIDPAMSASREIDCPDKAIIWDRYGITLDYSKLDGIDGIPRQQGRIHLEHHPDLTPFSARGLYSDPGTLYKLAKESPEVQAALVGPTKSLVSTKFRVEPHELPDFVSDEERSIRDKHTAFCERVFYRWGARAFRSYLKDVFATAPVAGFYLGELTAAHVQINGTDYLMPNLPAFRAPWAVEEWLHQGDALCGVKFQFGGTDTMGVFGAGGKSEVHMPIEKLVHVSVGQVGANWEGISWLRSSWKYIQILQKVVQLWAHGCEINALGVLVATTAKDNKGAVDHRKAFERYAGNSTAIDSPFVGMPPGWDLKVLTPSQSIPDLTPFVSILERMISKALGNSHQLIALQQAGSFAARDSATQESKESWNHIVDELIRDPIEGQIFDRFLRINFPEDAKRGYIFPAHIAAVDQTVSDPTVVIDATIKAQAAGLLDGEYGEYFRSLLRLPSVKSTNDGTV